MRNALTFLLLLILATNHLAGQGGLRLLPVDRVSYDMSTDLDPNAALDNSRPGTILGNSAKSSGIQITTQALGTASNIFTILRPEQNQVSVHGPSGRVTFIHRQDVSLWGGSSGNLRYDCSSDYGQTWDIDIGPLNPALTRPARYPNAALYTDNTGAQSILYSAATLDGANGWDGHVNGLVCDACSTNSTEHYDFILQDSYLPSGLCEGEPGEFWVADLAWDGSSAMDSVFLYKTIPANCDVTWQRVQTFTANWNSSPNGKVAIGPNVAFSPDGLVGYVVVMGDLAGGIDSIITPVYFKSEDGGESWSGPVEIDLSGNQMVIDSLQSLYGQQGAPPLGVIPVSSGEYTCTSDFDITVDRNGNLHIFNLLASASTLDSDSVVIPQSYSLFPGLAKLFVDIHTPDGGATWECRYIAPGIAWRGSFGTPTPVSLENFCQISRDDAGDRVFYSWVDQDSTGLFGVADMLLPDLRIAATRISDGYQTCWKMITDGDFAWGGGMLAPTLAPTVIDYGGTVALPIVGAQLVNNDPFFTTAFHYFGDAALIFDSEFQPPSNLNLAFPVTKSAGGCNGVGIEEAALTGALLRWDALWPNPTENELNLRFELGQFAEVEASLMDIHGRQVSAIFQGERDAGTTEIRWDQVLDLPAGIYLLRLQASSLDGRKEALTRRVVLGH